MKTQRLVLLAVILVVASPAIAGAQTNQFTPATDGVSFAAQQTPPASATSKPAEKRYLNIGADPQEPGLQPGPDEEVVVLDEDVCDDAWGTGSSKKLAGCYHKGTGAIRKKGTHVLIAIFFCGNRPGSRHIVSGKTIAIEVVEKITEKIVPIAMPTTIDWDKLREVIAEAVKNLPPPQVTVNTPVTVNVTTPPPATTTTTITGKPCFCSSTKCKVLVGIAGTGLGLGVSYAIREARRHDGTPAPIDSIVNPPTGGIRYSWR